LALLNEGLLVLGPELEPASANRAARRLLGWGEGALPRELPPSELAATIRRSLANGRSGNEVVRVWYPEQREISIAFAPLDARGAVVALRDVTEERSAHRIRRELVSHASHELKSPVASLQALAETVRDVVGEDPDAARRFSDKLVVESARLGQLIADLLDLSRLEEASGVPNQPVNISALARKAARAEGPQAIDKHMGLREDIEPDVLTTGDERLLELMLRNLLHNAVTYTPRGGTVRISVAPEKEAVRVDITDNGIGIPKDAQGRVFERFYRVDEGRARGQGGTGLGLAIVKHVVELHGGNVALDSEPGRGSTFTVRLPHRSTHPTDSLAENT
jgi:signal transduction histidine kinase